MRIVQSIFVCVCVAAVSCCGQVMVGISGYVFDQSSNPLNRAIVHLVAADLWDTTDGGGTYKLSGAAEASVASMPFESRYIAPRLRQGQVLFSVPGRTDFVDIALLSTQGKTVRQVFCGHLPHGSYSIDVAASPVLASQAYLLSIAVGKTSALLRGVEVRPRFLAWSKNTAGGQAPDLAATAAVVPIVDTLEIFKPGYATVRVPVSSYSAQLAAQKLPAVMP